MTDVLGLKGVLIVNKSYVSMVFVLKSFTFIKANYVTNKFFCLFLRVGLVESSQRFYE